MRILSIASFAVAFAFVESSVVVYLRSLYYPDGFTFPLKMIGGHHLWVEFAREFSTIVILVAAGALAGLSRWQRFAYFLIAFGVWDIFYYVWLKVILDWPATVIDWDILFLIPIPWIGPVIAPVLISLLMIIVGCLIVRREDRGNTFRPSRTAWILSILGTALILYTFTRDTRATMRFQPPESFSYGVFFFGFLCYCAAATYEFGLKRTRQS